MPLKPFHRQREFFAKYDATRKIVVWDGPNRAGKSMAAAMQCIEVLTGWPVESWPELPWNLRGVDLGTPRKIGCITVSERKSIDGQQQEIHMRLARCLVKSKPWNKKTGYVKSVVLANNSTVDFLSDVQREQELEQFAWDLVWIDEAVKAWVLERLVARLVDAGGKMIITAVAESPWIYRISRLRLMTPDSMEPVSPELIQVVSGTTMYDNELLDRQQITDAVELYGGVDSQQARMRVGGEYVHLEGVVFPEYDDVRHVDGNLVPGADWTAWEGADPGYRNPFAWLFMAVDANGIRWCIDEIYEKGATPERIAELVKQKRRLYGLLPPRKVKIDPAADHAKHWGQDVRSIRKALNDAGVATEPADTHAGTLDATLQLVRANLISGRLRVHARCKHLRMEFLNYKYGDPNKETGEFHGDQEKPVDANNHLISALRYVLQEQPHYVPLPKEAAPVGSPAYRLEQARLRQQRQERSPWK